MTDEPYTDTYGDIEMQSGIPVRLYNGGYNGCPTVSVPCASSGNDGDVLTLDNGAPVWLPPAGASDWKSVVKLPSDYWLLPGSVWFQQRDVPMSNILMNNSTGFTTSSVVFGDYAITNYDVDLWVLGSGTGTTISVPLPLTSDGQTLVTPRSGYSTSYFGPNCVPGGAYIYWTAQLSWTGGSTSYTFRLLNGSTPDTAANSYWGVSSSGSSIAMPVPSAINSTSTNPNTPTFVATLGASRDWTLTIIRWSIL